jgi:hypothetical protein
VIHVDRSRVFPLEFLNGSEVSDAQDEALKFFGRTLKRRAQESFDFPRLWQAPPVRSGAIELFSGKCAYCETPSTEPGMGDVEQFRPRMMSVGLDGEIDPDHYWFIAYFWTNLYFICSTCTRNKGNRFPVAGPRASLYPSASELNAEKRLLLDPCVDRPDEELLFHPDGLVTGRTERGKITTEVLSLNRPELIDSRKRAYESGLAIVTGFGPSDEVIESLRDPKRPFAAAWRQAILDVHPRLAGAVDTETAQVLPPGAPITKAAAKRSRAMHAEFQKEQQTYSLADEGPVAQSYFLTSRTIRRIRIRNMRAIRDLTLEFPSHEGGWLMLLGENATGKSTVLQSVALALMGEEYRREMTSRLEMDASRFVRRGTKSGSVQVWLNGLIRPIELHVRAGHREFEGSPPEPKTLVAGYGATRLLPRNRIEPVKPPKYADVENLFNPFEPLADASTWLAGLEPPAAFQEAAKSLRTLLPLDPRDKLVRTRTGKPSERIRAKFGGVTTSLDELSDGFQSVVALAADAMKVMLDQWSSMEAAEGIIAIDELGAHMHPRWKMQLVSGLRALFPKVQFLATTHDPLCLRGLRQGEVVVLNRIRRKGVFSITDLPLVEGLRADQLLTSEHFGLSSTLDPDTEAMFEDYYDLRAKDKLTAAERTRMQERTTWFKSRRLLGRDRRERLMLEAIDQYLADVHDEVHPEKRVALRTAALDEAERLYAAISPEPVD